MIKSLFLLIIFFSFSVSGDLYFDNIKVAFFSKSEETYLIKAKKHIKKFDKKNKKDIFKLLTDIQTFMLENSFYSDGYFETKSSLIHFQKAYKMGNKLYIFNANGKIKQFKVVAKKIVFTKNGYLLKKCELKTENKILRRKKFFIKR